MRLFARDHETRRFEDRVARALRDPASGVAVTDDPARACLFVPRVGQCLSVNRCPLPAWLAAPRLAALPYWHGTGRNHVLLDHADHPRAQVVPDARAPLRVRSASAAAYFRDGFDVGLSLRPKVSCYRRAVTDPGAAVARRRLLVGFLGAPTTAPGDDGGGDDDGRGRTVGGGGGGGVGGLRQRLARLHDPANRVDVRVRDPKCKVPCDRHEPEFYSEYRATLLGSKFQLVPRGAGLHSHRLLESLSAGSIPMVLADGMVLPFAELIPWEEAVVVVPEAAWQGVPDLARRLEADAGKMADMQCAGLAVYRNFFLRPGGGTVGLAFRLLQRRIRQHVAGSGVGAASLPSPPSPPLLAAWPAGRTPKMPPYCQGSKGWSAVEAAVARLNHL